jgi:23S rRNA (guanosine2251-2'-O)-methyltransferase
MGKRCVEEMIKHRRERIIHIYLLSSLQDRSHFEAVLHEHRIGFSLVAKNELFSMVMSESHQGIVAKIKDRPLENIDDFLQKDNERSLVLMLDGIEDPQNFGAIARSCECFKINGLIWSKNRGVDITPTAAKAACGAFELLDLIKVSNLANSVEKFKKMGYEIICADVNVKGEPVNSFKFAEKSLLIVGSEQVGIQALLKKMATRFIYIPMEGDISSLNVAQATSILLYSWRFPGNF